MAREDGKERAQKGRSLVQSKFQRWVKLYHHLSGLARKIITSLCINPNPDFLIDPE